MKYFAYGSNMSLARIKERVPSAHRLGAYFLEGRDLRFHKAGKDGSGKCDAFSTSGNERVYGALYEINPDEKPALDRAEGLGVEYSEKLVSVTNDQGETIEAFTYFALKIDDSLKPYTWYLNHVLIGARESQLPENYIQKQHFIQLV